ncbi:hypothetical protein MNBD_CHLOROFLEXI01-5069 [hydrothermal vent metagenome]|uniref:Uncharacterized protein n=1 Tax=hydrothermal vent metagenome TaxID=652676 RepID=A0A3B0VH10_9ZZZZ
MQPLLVNQEVSIVVRGDFTPAIFQPFWFASNNLIKEAEAEAAQVKILTPTVTDFSAEWLSLNVVTNRFQIKTEQEPYFEPLRDLGIGLFTLLPDTPLRVMGINSNFVYNLHSEDDWHSLGHRLTPKEAWNQILDSSGMRAVIIQGERSDDYDGYIQVSVQPIHNEEVEFGVFVAVNDHFVLAEENRSDKAQEVIEILSQSWTNSMERGLEIAKKAVRFGEGQ